ncbi:MAG: acyl-CoA dehydrogenase family protein [Actinomycetota bacterium]|nr:acyl-CoA dehydrogenase family protein [Actinomycetota bacterium]
MTATDITDTTDTTSTFTALASTGIELPIDMLERFRSRAGVLDRTNSYFHDDLAELRSIGYLAAAVPVEFGGWGLDLAQLAASQRRLAQYAPATALATSMHAYWIGTAVELERAGDSSLRWMFDAALQGDVFAAGHAETGNDIPVLLSTCQAERVEGGYRLTGRKQFGSNGPVWRWLGAHAIDVAAPGGPQIVHAFVDRDSEGVTVVETWDTLGMRPTQSHDTILDGVFVPDARIGRVVPAGDENDLFLVGLAMWPLSLMAAVYLGIADRALEVAVAGAKRKTSMAIPRGAYAYNPFVQHQVAEMYLELDAASATLEQFVSDWVAGVDHGDAWATKVYSMKWRAVEAAKRVVDIALDVSGGAGMFAGNELERLYRDVRCGGFHPGNDALTHELVGKAVIGILAEQPRW